MAADKCFAVLALLRIRNGQAGLGEITLLVPSLHHGQEVFDAGDLVDRDNLRVLFIKAEVEVAGFVADQLIA